LKVLNLYAGIGGNRKLWSDVEVTAVEYNDSIAKVYADLYKQDNVVVGDAHEYLRLHFDEFDFIWSSPPCQTHSSFRQNICVRFRKSEPKFPDMRLYEEVLFLQYNAKCPWVVENVKPYYKPLIPATEIQRHLFWSNFDIPVIEMKKDNLRSAQIDDLQKHHGIDLSGYTLPNKRQVLRNCVYPEVGKYILDEIKNKQCGDKY
jgi:DNA (cytosine-5)-methyltransferase 1